MIALGRDVWVVCALRCRRGREKDLVVVLLLVLDLLALLVQSEVCGVYCVVFRVQGVVCSMKCAECSEVCSV